MTPLITPTRATSESTFADLGVRDEIVQALTEDGIKLMREHSFRASERWRAALHAAIGPDELGALADGLERLLHGMEAAVILHPRDEG